MSPTRPSKTTGSRIVGVLRGIFVHNLRYKLMSLLIALLLWLFVLLGEVVSRPVEVPLSFKLPPGTVLVSDVPKQVRVMLSGPWATINGFNTERLDETEIDLTKAELGSQVVYLEDSFFHVPPGLRVSSVTPLSFTVTLAKRGRKEVNITAGTIGQLPEGYAVKAVKVQPEKVTLEGSTSDLMFIDEVTTEPIKVDGRRESFTQSVTLEQPSKNVQMRQSGPVQATVIIKRDLAEAVFKNVPVEVRHSRYRTKCIPESIAVTLLGPRSALQDLGAVPVHAFVDATKEEGDLPGTTTVRDVEFDPLPNGIKVKAQLYTIKLQITAEPPSPHTP